MLSTCIAAIAALSLCCGCGVTNQTVPIPIERSFHYEAQLVNETPSFIARDGAGLLSYDGSLFLIGGWGSTYVALTGMSTGNDVQRSEDGVLWDEIKANDYRWWNSTPYTELDWEGRHSHSVEVFMGKMWIIGGDYNSNHYQKDIWVSENGSTWERKFSNLPFLERIGHISYVRNGCLVVMGGQKIIADSFENSYFGDAAKTCDGETWTTFNIQADSQFFPVGYTDAGVVDGYAYVVNKGYYQTNVHGRIASNRLYRTNDDIHWEYVHDAPVEVSMYSNVIGWGHHLFVLNGGFVPEPNEYPKETNQVAYLDVRTWEWKKIENVPWSYRHAAAVTIHNDQLFMATGTTMPGGVKKDVWKIVKVFDDL